LKSPIEIKNRKIELLERHALDPGFPGFREGGVEHTFAPDADGEASARAAHVHSDTLRESDNGIGVHDDGLARWTKMSASK